MKENIDKRLFKVYVIVRIIENESRLKRQNAKYRNKKFNIQTKRTEKKVKLFQFISFAKGWAVSFSPVRCVFT